MRLRKLSCTIDFSLFLLAAVLLALPLRAAENPNFTGTWKLNEAQSAQGQNTPRGIVFRINHKEPIFKYTASGETAEGQPFSEALELTTDGKGHPGPASLQAAAHWDSAVLVVQFTDAKGAEIAQVRYELGASGRQMIRVTTIKGAGGPHREVYDKQ